MVKQKEISRLVLGLSIVLSVPNMGYSGIPKNNKPKIKQEVIHTAQYIQKFEKYEKSTYQKQSVFKYDKKGSLIFSKEHSIKAFFKVVETRKNEEWVSMLVQNIENKVNAEYRIKIVMNEHNDPILQKIYTVLGKLVELYQYEYDIKYRLIRQSHYDSNGHVIEHQVFIYNNKDQIEAVQYSQIDSIIEHWEQWQYNEQGDHIITVGYDGFNNVLWKKTYEHDKQGNWIKRIVQHYVHSYGKSFWKLSSDSIRVLDYYK